MIGAYRLLFRAYPARLMAISLKGPPRPSGKLERGRQFSGVDPDGRYIRVT
jgi:hypothetical protein